MSDTAQIAGISIMTLIMLLAGWWALWSDDRQRNCISWLLCAALIIGVMLF